MAPYAPSMSASFSMPAPAVKPPPPGSKGSLAHTLHMQGGGVWAPTPEGLRWCGAKAASATPFDITKSCLASVLPDSMDKDLYCSRDGKCPHKLGFGFTSIIKQMLPHPSELITTKETKVKLASSESSAESSKKTKTGRGSKGGRSGGRGGRGSAKKE